MVTMRACGCKASRSLYQNHSAVLQVFPGGLAQHLYGASASIVTPGHESPHPPPLDPGHTKSFMPGRSVRRSQAGMLAFKIDSDIEEQKQNYKPPLVDLRWSRLLCCSRS